MDIKNGIDIHIPVEILILLFSLIATALIHGLVSMCLAIGNWLRSTASDLFYEVSLAYDNYQYEQKEKQRTDMLMK